MKSTPFLLLTGDPLLRVTIPLITSNVVRSRVKIFGLKLYPSAGQNKISHRIVGHHMTNNGGGRKGKESLFTGYIYHKITSVQR